MDTTFEAYEIFIESVKHQYDHAYSNLRRMDGEFERLKDIRDTKIDVFIRKATDKAFYLALQDMTLKLLNEIPARKAGEYLEEIAHRPSSTPDYSAFDTCRSLGEFIEAHVQSRQPENEINAADSLLYYWNEAQSYASKLIS